MCFGNGFPWQIFINNFTHTTAEIGRIFYIFLKTIPIECYLLLCPHIPQNNGVMSLHYKKWKYYRCCLHSSWWHNKSVLAIAYDRRVVGPRVEKSYMDLCAGRVSGNNYCCQYQYTSFVALSTTYCSDEGYFLMNFTPIWIWYLKMVFVLISNSTRYRIKHWKHGPGIGQCRYVIFIPRKGRNLCLNVF